MHKLLYPFTNDVLEATVKRGGLWFVRNTFNYQGKDEEKKSIFLITHYNDAARAETHFNVISADPHRFLYRWEVADECARLKIAANQPEGYQVLSAYFYPDYKKKVPRNIKEKVNAYIYSQTLWRPAGSDTVQVDLYLQFGILYLHLKHEGEELKIKFADILKLK